MLFQCLKIIPKIIGNYLKTCRYCNIEVRSKTMNMAANGVLVSSYTKDSHDGNSSTLSPWHSLQWLIGVVVNI